MNVINKHQTRWSSTLFENVYFSQSENRYANYQYIYPKNIIEIFVVARLTSRLLHCSMEWKLFKSTDHEGKQQANADLFPPKGNGEVIFSLARKKKWWEQIQGEKFKANKEQG